MLQTLVLDDGDHETIKWPTCARFDDAQIVKVEKLNKLEAAGTIVRKGPFKPEIVKRANEAFERAVSYAPDNVRLAFVTWKREWSSIPD